MIMKNRFTVLALTFVSGIILGVAAIGLFSFTKAGAVPAVLPGVNRISPQEASALFKGYYNTANPSNEVMRGFAINMEQLSALNTLAGENPGLSGFRIYMGYDGGQGSVGIVVGINASGQDETGSIYKASAGGSGPCPTICDGSSSIIAN